jgi:uncharacterized protein YodC (DUF2158 family)
MVGIFEVGNEVQLKSGGVPMTVEKIDGDHVLCVWSEGSTVQRATFASATLKKYVAPSIIFEVL